jgi:hypothetical protein
MRCLTADGIKCTRSRTMQGLLKFPHLTSNHFCSVTSRSGSLCPKTVIKVLTQFSSVTKHAYCTSTSSEILFFLLASVYSSETCRKVRPTVLMNSHFFIFTAQENLYTILRKILINKKAPWPECARELFRPSDRRLSAKLVPTLADRGCNVVSVTDHYGRNLGFSRPQPLLFLSSSSSIVLTRLSGPRSRPINSQKIW